MSLLPTISTALLLAGFAISVLLIIIDWLRRSPEASEEEVRQAVVRYREAYGDAVQHVLTDHIHGARLARASRHRRLLRRVRERISEDGQVKFQPCRSACRLAQGRAAEPSQLDPLPFRRFAAPAGDDMDGG
jgi:hypothetical protein